MSPIHKDHLKDTIGSALEAILKEDNGRKALKILSIISYFAPEDIDVEIFLSLVDNAKELTAVVELLERHALISSKPDSKGVITADESVKAFMKTKDKSHVKEAILRKALELFYFSNRSCNVDHAVSVWVNSIEYPELVKKFALLPIVVFYELMDSVKLKEAYSLSFKAFMVLKNVVSDNHYALARLKCEISILLCFQDEFENATSLVLSVQLKNIESCAVEELRPIIIRIAEKITESSQFDKAIVIYENILGNEDEILETCDYWILRGWENYADLLGRMGSFFKSEKLMEIVLDRRLNLIKLPNYFPSKKMLRIKFIVEINKAGNVFLSESKFKEALKVFRFVYQEFENILGINDVDTVEAKGNLAFALLNTEEYAEAVMVLNEVADKAEELYGRQHPYYIASKCNLAAVLVEEDKCKEALEILVKLFQEQSITSSKNNRLTLKNKKHIAYMFLDLKMYDEAIIAFKETHKGYEEIFGSDHPKTKKILDKMCFLQSSISILERKLFNVIQSAKYDDCDQIHSEIENGAKVNGKDSCGNTPLHIAAKCGYLKVVELLLRKGACYNVKNKEGQTPLQLAKRKPVKHLLTSVNEMFNDVKAGNHQELAKYISAQKSFMNLKDSEDCCLFHWAAYYGHTDTLKLLLESGVDVSFVTNKGNTALHLAVSKSHFEVVEIILQYCKQKKLDNLIDAQTTLERSTCLHIAVKKGSLSLVKTLLTHGAIYNLSNRDSKVPLDLSNNPMISYFLKLVDQLFQDATKGSSEIINVLLYIEYDMFQAVTNTRNSKGKTLLDILEQNELDSIANRVKELIKDRSGNCTLLRKTLELEELLKLRRVIDVHVQFSRLYRFILKCIIKSDSFDGYLHFDISEETDHYLSNVHCLIEEHKKYFHGLIQDESIRALVESLNELLVDKNESKSFNKLRSGNVQNLRSFVEVLESRVEAHVHKYLQWVEEQSQIHILEKLLKAIENNNDVEVEACLNENVSVINGEMSVESVEWQKMPLHYAVGMGYSKIVETLLEKGAKVTQSSKQGLTPLHVACDKGCEAVVEILMRKVGKEELSSFVNAQMTDCGSSALHLAAKNGSVKIVTTLLNHGAKYNAKNSDGETPLQCSTKKDVSDLLELVERHFNAAAEGHYQMFYEIVSTDFFQPIISARNEEGRLIYQEAVVNKQVVAAGHLLLLMRNLIELDEETTRIKPYSKGKLKYWDNFLLKQKTTIPIL